MASIKRRPVPNQGPDAGQAWPLIKDPSHSRVLSIHSPDSNHKSPVFDPDYTSSPQNKRGYSALDGTPPSPPQDHGSDPPSQPSDRAKRYHFARFWAWELSALFLAVGLMAAKVAVLSHFEGRELPDWPLSINLSALIALFSIIQRAALLLIIAEIIGQARWMWFTERPRPLLHLHEFDEASRSVLGSLRLIFVSAANQSRLGIKLLVLLAAWITVLSFAIGPFSQQAFDTTPCQRLIASGVSKVPISHYVPGTSTYYRIHAGGWEVDADMKGAMLNGLTRPNASDTAIRASCPSGECKFPDYGSGITYSSIGICSRCLDSSSFITAPDDEGNMTLGDGTFLNFGLDKPWFNVQPSNLSYAEELFTDEFAALASDALFNVSIMSVSRAPCDESPDGSGCPRDWSDGQVSDGEFDVVAASCTMYTCMQSYHGSVKGGNLQERVVSSEPALVNIHENQEGLADFYSNYTGFQSPCVLDNGTWYTAENASTAPTVEGREFANITLSGRNTTAPEECLYKVIGVYGLALKAFLTEMMTGSCLHNSRQGPFLHCGTNWWLAPLYNNQTATVESLTDHVEALAIAMTNHFRKTGLGAHSSLASGPLPAEAAGEIFERTTCTTVDWRWLMLPILLVAATAILMVWTMLPSRFRDTRQPVWKGSVLPLLFYGLKGDSYSPVQSGDAQQSRRLADLSELHALSRDKVVHFDNGTTGMNPGFYPETANKETGGC